MMKIYITYFIIIIFSGSFLAQENKMVRANKTFNELDYIEAQKIYLAVAEKGFESEELFTRLANTYYFNAQYAEAEKWFNKLIVKYPDVPTLIYLRYAQVLRSMGKDSQAQEIFNTYASKEETFERTAADYMAMIEENSQRYFLTPLDGIYDENNIAFGHTVKDGVLYFSSSVNATRAFNATSGWDGLPYLSLKQVKLNNDLQVEGSADDFSWRWNSPYHESSVHFIDDGVALYYTANNRNPHAKEYSKNLKIYRSQLVDGKWTEPEDLNINNDLFSTAHPAFNTTHDTLYFASDRPGGYGQSDLYRVAIGENGPLGPPENLGPKINTAGKETFPFISKKNELYFSSDGHFGLGGLDVFYIKIGPYGPENLLNVGRPINSYADDFAFGIVDDKNRGFVSSNRSTIAGNFVKDNIYSFVETAPIKDLYKTTLSGVVTDKKTGEVLKNATISASSEENPIPLKTVTDSLGMYAFTIQRDDQYWVKAEMEGYDTEEKITQAGLLEQELNFQLQPNRVKSQSGEALSEFLNIPNVYFDYDKATIRADAQIELEKLVAVLETYPSIKLNIWSHTDSRGSARYNSRLSEERASATRNYLIGKGIDPLRLNSKGFGEEKLRNGCSDGVDCTEEEHQLNRRSEFIITN